jgi:hypothetical protein
VAADQAFRLFDLAIDFCEDVPPLPRASVARIADIFTAHGATAKVSSIHVNGWFGAFDKLTMARRFMHEVDGINLEDHSDAYAFVGDSPNDASMFAALRHTFGVANVRPFLDQMPHAPAFALICASSTFSMAAPASATAVEPAGRAAR